MAKSPNRSRHQTFYINGPPSEGTERRIHECPTKVTNRHARTQSKHRISSHLIIPAGKSPNAHRRFLRYLVVRLPKARNWPLPRLVPHIYEAERQVIEKNLEFYRKLEDAAESAGKQNPAPILKSLLALARLQTLKLHKYRFDDGFFQRRIKAAA